jgi:TPR repeat protein
VQDEKIIEIQVMQEAWYWLKASASKGHAAACCALGDLALEGFDSTEGSSPSAIHWYQQASALGACANLLALGLCAFSRVRVPFQRGLHN